MAIRATCLAALLAARATAQQDGTLLLQSSASAVDDLSPKFLPNLDRSGRRVNLSGEGLLMVDSNFEEGSFGLLPESAPAWCKDEAQLTWKQRKERMQQHITLEWSKKMVKQMLEQNETVPEWMDRLVSDDEKRGRTKWAVAESKRMKAEGKETPKWMDELVAEDAKWANRWAACKVASLQQANEEAPQWMIENGRKGIMDAASEKAAELQEEIDEMEEEKDKDTAVVDAQGDVQVANQRMLAKKREFSARSVSSQFRVLEAALEELDAAEKDMLSEGTAKAPTHRFKRALRQAKSASNLLDKLLERKGVMLNSQMQAAQ